MPSRARGLHAFYNYLCFQRSHLPQTFQTLKWSRTFCFSIGSHGYRLAHREGRESLSSTVASLTQHLLSQLMIDSGFCFFSTLACFLNYLGTVEHPLQDLAPVSDWQPAFSMCLPAPQRQRADLFRCRLWLVSSTLLPSHSFSYRLARAWQRYSLESSI